MSESELACIKTELARILPLRALFLQEANRQVRYDAVHERGWSDSWLLRADGVEVGYGAVMGQERADRDTIFEFYVNPPFRRLASRLAAELLQASGARLVECQSNDTLCSAMLFECTRNIHATTVLFGAGSTTTLTVPGAVFRPKRGDDRMFEHTAGPEGDFVVEFEGAVVATGGFLTHYNSPFADIYMEVAPTHRRRGIGAFLVQGVITQCYLAGRLPAARCSLDNVASRATLNRAGLKESGFMLIGEVAPPR